MDDEIKRIRRKLRDDYPHYSKKCLMIRSKSGNIQPFELNKAQWIIHNAVEQQRREIGRIRAIILKGRQQGCCFSEHMRVLRSNYEWVKIGDVKVGDTLFGIEEEPTGKSKTGRKIDRKIKLTIVEAKVYFKKEAFEISLSNGVKLEVTGNHRMLFKQRGGCLNSWRSIDSAKVGDYIRSFSYPPQNYQPNYEDGWFAGLLDGEGSFGCYPAARISISQNDGVVLERCKKYLNDRGIRYYELIDRRKSDTSSKFGDKEVHCIRIDRQADIIKILTMTRPSRFIIKPEFVGKSLPNSCDGFDAWIKIESIKSIGEIEVIDIQTDAKTYICEGLVSHNSTYIEGRFYWRVTHRFGVRAFILTHDNDATNNLFEMANRFHEHCPLLVRPSIDASNAKELIFGALDSGYKLGTAGNKAVGRSSTIQYLHGSEVAYWPNASEHAKGILQAVPNDADTEVYLESTANGLGNYFHEQWQLAETKQSDFIAIFIPWFLQDEYQRSVTIEFKPNDEELELKRLYDISDSQLEWRRAKIIELSVGGLDGTRAFNQEYPCSAVEAFQTTGEDNFIVPGLVMAARKCADLEAFGNLVIGVDPARFGDDRTSIISRRGRSAFSLRSYTKKDTMEVAAICHRIIIEECPARMCIDIGGLGAGVYDRLKELGHADVIVPVNGGSIPLDQKKYFNKRAEMWGLMREWLCMPPVQLPDSDTLHADLCGIKYRIDVQSRLVMEKKEDMKRRGIRSPDEADALALTFAVPEKAIIATKQKVNDNIAKSLMGAANHLDRLKKAAYER